jgi:hypothetical protein
MIGVNRICHPDAWRRKQPGSVMSGDCFLFPRPSPSGGQSLRILFDSGSRCANNPRRARLHVPMTFDTSLISFNPTSLVHLPVVPCSRPHKSARRLSQRGDVSTVRITQRAWTINTRRVDISLTPRPSFTSLLPIAPSRRCDRAISHTIRDTKHPAYSIPPALIHVVIQPRFKFTTNTQTIVTARTSFSSLALASLRRGLCFQPNIAHTSDLRQRNATLWKLQSRLRGPRRRLASDPARGLADHLSANNQPPHPRPARPRAPPRRKLRRLLSLRLSTRSDPPSPPPRANTSCRPPLLQDITTTISS